MYMKKKGLLLLLIMVILSITACGQNDGVSGENISVESVFDWCVTVRPVCPSCNHIGMIEYANISEGESFKRQITCEGCKKTFIITVQR